MKTKIAVLVLLLATPASIHAACDVKKPDMCTIGDLDIAFHNEALAGSVDTDVEKKVGNQNRATIAPDPFASHLHNSYQDFIAPFSFAINTIEESKDGQSLIARFNMIRKPPVAIGFTATATKPKLYDKITQSIPQTQRTDLTSQIEKKLGDFDDVTLAGSFALESSPEQCATPASVCFGRDPKTYRRLLSAALKPLLEKAAAVDSPETEQAELDLTTLMATPDSDGTMVDRSTKVGDIKSESLRAAIVAAAKKAGQAGAMDSRKALAILSDAGIDNIATLIDNQPQLSLTGSWRNLGELGGPDEYAFTGEFQFGFTNLMSTLRKDNLLAVLKEDQTDIDSNKVVGTFSYKRANRYNLSAVPGVVIDGFAPIDVPRTSALSAKLQWGRKLGVKVKTQQARFDISSEFERNANDGIRNKNRGVGTATLTIPYSEKASIPLSIEYANKPEFLTDERKKLSVHFGLSYRFPWEPSPSQ